jgi:hypothetical protein
MREHRLRIFENGVLRRIFGPKREEVTGQWKEVHNEELHNLYCSLSIALLNKEGCNGCSMYRTDKTYIQDSNHEMKSKWSLLRTRC